ncbi:MAG: AMP-binding protein [Firmicutes bacterium]|nr:AMP-binding protein [Bacillota bacterium]
MREARDAVTFWLKEYAGEGVSVAHLLCDRHARIPDRIALFYEDASGEGAKYTFAELRDLSGKLAGFLQGLGVGKGDRVAVMLPKTPELAIAALAVWRLGAVYLPLFTAFGPDAIAYRLRDSGARLVITDANNRGKLAGMAEEGLAGVITVAGPRGMGLERGDYSFWHELERAGAPAGPVSLAGDDLMILLYTSGTTGNPKGVEIPVRALASFEAYMRFGLDLREEDMYWNLADPGWAYGLYYNLMGPLLIGKATLFYNAPFSPAGTYKILEKYRVTNLAAAPTAYRAIIAAGEDLARRARLSLRVASSAGEPLNPKVIAWTKEMWGVPVYDHFGQTELGMVVNNHHLPELEEEIKPGSMGKSMPGFRVVVVDREGHELGPNHEGELAVDVAQSPLFWFRRYWNDEGRTRERFTPNGRYYLTGDAAKMDEDGYFFFTGRSDDIILSAGYRIGPFEVESALMQHEAVAEAAVVGKPDELRGEIVKAYVVLKQGFSASDALAEELREFVKKRLSAHEYPREIEFVAQLPKTPSGKIQRFLLRKQHGA